MRQDPKTQNLTKLKKLKCAKKNVISLKNLKIDKFKNSKCDRTPTLTKIKNSKCDKTQNSRCDKT